MGMATDLINKVKGAAAAKAAGDAQTENLGKELGAKADMMSQARKALSGDTTPAAAAPAKKAPVVDSGKRYGDNPREKRMDVREALRPLGSFKTGTDYVPKTGMYKLHEGEAVKTKEENAMDATTAMEKITGKKGVPEKKIHKITTHKTDDGKMIHTHQHHHPAHHPDETHVSNNIGEAQDHLAAQEPNMSAQAPAMPEAGPTPGM